MSDKKRDPLDEARSAYIKLLKDTEELTPELLAMAKESFTEGWVQCERYFGVK